MKLLLFIFAMISTSRSFAFITLYRRLSVACVSQSNCFSIEKLRVTSNSSSVDRRKVHDALYRMFGSKRCIEGNPPGKIEIYNEQTTLPNIDLACIEQTISTIRDIIGYPTYDVSLILNEDEAMREINLETRGIDKPTDILSFQFQEKYNTPGDLVDPDFDIPEYYNLGDMLIDVPYILRRIDEDKKFNEGTEESGVNDHSDHDTYYDDEDYVGDDERGVSGIMATVYDPQERIQLLLVHGMLHLVGFDHIEDDDYELMVRKEEEVIRVLQNKLDKKWCD